MEKSQAASFFNLRGEVYVMRNRLLAVVLIISFLFLCSCGRKEVFKTDKLKVCTSFYVVCDFVKKVGGDKIEVVNIIPAGVEPHDFEPSPKDLVTLSKADVLFCNGLGMESWIDKIKNTAGGLRVEEIARGLEVINGDPHVWLNPLNVKEELRNIKDVLVELDENNREYYEENYNKYAKCITDLDKEYEDRLSNCTKDEIVVTHSAFGYLCYRYGLGQVALKGISDDDEPSIKKMSEVIKFIKENNVRAVFWENEKDKKIVKVIAKETGVSTLKLETLENMTLEGRDYFSVMRSNLDSLVIALK